MRLTSSLKHTFVTTAFLSLVGSNLLPVAQAETVLEHARDIRALSPQEADRGMPVRLRAVVTYYDAAQSDLFVQDSTAGIYVELKGAVGRPDGLWQGQQIEMTGITASGDFAPEVVKPRIRILGPGVLPAPRKVSIEEISSGEEDSQWVEGEGVVHAAAIEDKLLVLNVFMGGQRMRIRILSFPPSAVGELVGSRLRFRGACGATFNHKRQLTGLLVYLQDFKDVQVEETAQTGMAHFPLRHADSLLRFTPSASRLRDHNMRVRVHAGARCSITMSSGDRINRWNDCGSLSPPPVSTMQIPATLSSAPSPREATRGSSVDASIWAWKMRLPALSANKSPFAVLVRV